MLSATTYSIVILSIIIFEFVFERVIATLNNAWRSKTPVAELADLYDEEEYQKQQAYGRVNSRFAWLTSGVSLLGILVLLLLDGFAVVDGAVREYVQEPILITLAFFAVLGLASDLLSMPFSIYSTFVIEERFGFNKTTVKTFILDRIKGYLLAAVIGGVLVTAVVWIYNNTGENFWWIAWAVMSGFTLLATTFFAPLILPLFNKMIPLEEGELRVAIEQYCAEVGFTIKNLYVMDGSKRSSKANAFFSGLGPQKRIVLYDTLIEQHTTEELVAVLAHEVGHYKKRHTAWQLIVSTLQMGLMLWIFSIMMKDPALYQALGVDQPSFHIGVLAFGLLYSPLSLITGLLTNKMSRIFEFQADDYAVRTANGKALQSALKKMSVKHLSNLTPHPAFVFAHYSHPPLAERLKAMQEVEK